MLHLSGIFDSPDTVGATLISCAASIRRYMAIPETEIRGFIASHIDRCCVSRPASGAASRPTSPAIVTANTQGGGGNSSSSSASRPSTSSGRTTYRAKSPMGSAARASSRLPAAAAGQQGGGGGSSRPTTPGGQSGSVRTASSSAASHAHLHSAWDLLDRFMLEWHSRASAVMV